jgi:hypothetical protein
MMVGVFVVLGEGVLSEKDDVKVSFLLSGWTIETMNLILQMQSTSQENNEKKQKACQDKFLHRGASQKYPTCPAYTN